MGLHVQALGAGHDLILLHPVGLRGEFWLPVARRLVHRFRLHLVDLPGHGRSPLDAVGPELANYADAVAQWIAGNVTGHYGLIGLSFGGMITQTIAARNPSGLRAAAICGCGCTFPEEIRPIIRARGTAALDGGMGNVIEATLERWFTPSFRNDPAVGEVARQLEAMDVTSWVQAWNAISKLNTLPHLREIKVPTLCVAGVNDEATSTAMVRQTADAIPGSRYVVLDGAPHMMQIERPNELSSVLVMFFDAVWSAGST